MNIYLISQSENEGYDTFDAAVVVAETEEAARNTLPADYAKFGGQYGVWCSSPDKVEVKLIGTAAEGLGGVVLASFNAG